MHSPVQKGNTGRHKEPRKHTDLDYSFRGVSNEIHISQIKKSKQRNQFTGEKKSYFYAMLIARLLQFLKSFLFSVF